MSIGTWSSFYTPYNEDVVDRNVPEGPGVYALFVKYKNGTWKCYYVGKSNDLNGRLKDHLGDSEQNDCIQENNKYERGFRWLSATTEGERSGIEKFVYDQLKPECNDQDPGGNSIRVTLPQGPS